MKIVCCWHTPPKIIGLREPHDNPIVTGGMCDECLAKYFPVAYTKKRKALGVSEQDRYPDFIKIRRES